jgi:hypothetical protein
MQKYKYKLIYKQDSFGTIKPENRIGLSSYSEEITNGI